ncbi:unnamed protein product [Phytomonas sp. EM1]|nr:unnamed protein product [Phytomonas sp. EM1]|eukprot:CCW64175.1 unnamed protein product [Phytomonas sp. isolate EM1]
MGLTWDAVDSTPHTALLQPWVSNRENEGAPFDATWRLASSGATGLVVSVDLSVAFSEILIGVFVALDGFNYDRTRSS